MVGLEKYANGELLFDGHYRLLRLLSLEGGSADVWLAEDADTVDTRLSEEDEESLVPIEGSGVLVAIKIYRPRNILDIDGEQNFRQEFKTVFSCHHANLLQPTDFSICDGMPYLVMPFCEKGSAEQFVGKLAEDAEMLWKFIHDVASGLAYLHACNPPIIHQDIKPANILIDANENFCITDFGISVKSGVGNDYYIDNDNSGTVIYMPPERFKDGYEAMAASDIWSLGATVYELITGDVPFGQNGGRVQQSGGKVPEIKARVAKKIKKLVYACLDPDPAKRPSAQQVAEIASQRDRKHVTALVVGGFFVFGTVTAILFFQNRPETVDEFTQLCNRGDSIINIECQDAGSLSLVDRATSECRLFEAVAFYEKALRQETDDYKRRKQVEKRTWNIKEVILPMLEHYEGICDTLRIAEEDNVPLRIEEFMAKKERVSNEIKSKIVDL